MSTEQPAHANTRMLTFKGGGWVIALAGLISLALLAWGLWPALTRGHSAFQTPDEYGFDLSALTVPKDELVATALPFPDFFPKLDHPSLVDPEFIGEQIRFGRAKYVVSSDHVIGVVIEGEPRAYPLSIFNVHENINDTIGSTPITVTYHPWCDSVAVYERSLAGETVELGSSGLILDSNAVLYDRREDRKQSSLFRQINGEAIAGPAAARGESLTKLACSVTTWADWHAAHPDTTVIAWDIDLNKRYKGSHPDQYFRSSKLQFPVTPMPPDDTPITLKDRVLVVTTSDTTRVYPFPVLDQLASADGVFRDEFDGTTIEIGYDRLTRCATLVQPAPIGAQVQVTYAMWFAWFAVHGDSDVVGFDQLKPEAPASSSP